MPEDNKKETPKEDTTLSAEGASEQEQPMHVRNPFTGEKVNITQEQLDSIEKGIEAQTERD